MAEALVYFPPPHLTPREIEHIRWLASYDYHKEGEPYCRWPRGSEEADIYLTTYRQLQDEDY